MQPRASTFHHLVIFPKAESLPAAVPKHHSKSWGGPEKAALSLFLSVIKSVIKRYLVDLKVWYAGFKYFNTSVFPEAPNPSSNMVAVVTSGLDQCTTQYFLKTYCNEQLVS